jgi:branched-chain amino acid transport system permease protein
MLVVALPEVFRDFQVYRMLAFGLMLMVLMIFRPHGLLTAEGPREQEEPAAAAVEPEAGG